MNGAVPARLVRAAFAGLAVFGAGAHGFLLAGAAVPGAWLPLGLGGGALAGWWVGERRPAAAGTPAPRWVVVVAALLLVALVGAMAYGALATGSRHWDGHAAWDLRAAFLALEPTLEQPLFADPAVACHARDYPLLQPLLVGLGDGLLGAPAGRLSFPLLYLLLLGTVAAAVGRRGVWTWAVVVGLALTPMLVNPTSGGVDSGYGELLLATALAGVAAAIVLREPVLFASAVVVAVWSKPEGLVFAALAVAVVWWRIGGVLVRAGVAGWTLAAVLWLPLQLRLGFATTPPVGLVAAVMGIGAAVWWSDRLLPRRRRWIAGVPALLLVAALAGMAAGGEDSSFAAHLEAPARALERLPRLPGILAEMVERGLFRGRFAGTWWLLIAVLLLGMRRPAGRRTRAVVAFVLLGLVLVMVPFLLAPEQDFEHHVKSSLDRLLLHWTAAAWLVIGRRGGHRAAPAA